MVHEYNTYHLDSLQQSLYRLLHEFCDHDLAVTVTLTVIASLLQKGVRNDPAPYPLVSADGSNMAPPHVRPTSATGMHSDEELLARNVTNHPLCDELLKAYRQEFQMPSKTPLSILYEYATRQNLLVHCKEAGRVEGMFTWTLQLKDDCNALSYTSGTGRVNLLSLPQSSSSCLAKQACNDKAQSFQEARSKKEAKQRAAAALLETLLSYVPFHDLLYRAGKDTGGIAREDLRFIFSAMPQEGWDKWRPGGPSWDDSGGRCNSATELSWNSHALSPKQGRAEAMSHVNGLVSCVGDASKQRKHGEQLHSSVVGLNGMGSYRAVSTHSSLADGLGCLDLHPTVCESLLRPWHVSQLPSPDTLGQF